jgi:two-component system chemotaxis response regulator CheY
MKILIAEDQAPTSRYLRRLLEQMGHEVIEAGDGEEAWELIRRDQSLLLISDWMMPRLDGLELCRRIRSQITEGYIYIILLSARTGRDDKLKGLNAGADDFLTKPLDADELCVRLEIASRILEVHQTLGRQNSRLIEMATTDELTGVNNRRRFGEDLHLHAALAARHGLPLSLIMLDVDHFKHFNDSFGHPAGDEVLRTIATILRSEVREHDLVARYGGEEFVLLLPSTGSEAATEVAERLRKAISKGTWNMVPLTASFGVATTDPTHSISVEELIAQADEALYHSKNAGRNRVTHIWSPPDSMVLPAVRSPEPEETVLLG